MPTVRRPEASNLFIRDWWDQKTKESAIRFRLFNRLAFPDGLREQERDALRRIAAGEHGIAETIGPGVPIDPALAKRALDAEWLKPR